MSVKDCKTKILDPEIQKKLFGDKEIPKQALNELANAIEAIKKSSDIYPEGGNFTVRVMKFLQERTELNEVEKGIKATNLRLIRENGSFLTQPAFKGKPVEAVLARLRQTTTLANGSKLNMDNTIATLKNNWFKASLGEIERKGLTDLFIGGAHNGLDTEITVAVHALTNGKAVEGVSQQAKDIAEIIHSFNKMALADHRLYGVPLRDMGTFVSMQTHDAEAVAKAGYEQWRNFVRGQGIDKEKLFGDALGDIKREDEILQGIFDNIVSGQMAMDSYGGEAIEDGLRTAQITKSHLSRLTETRHITFTDGHSEDAYRKAFGGKSLSEQMTAYIQSHSKSLGMVATWGSNPDAAFFASIDRLHDFLVKNGDEAGARSLKPSPDSYNHVLTDQYRATAGYNNIPSKQSLATIGARVRLATSLSKLGLAGFKSLGNIAQTAVAISDQTGKNVIAATLDTLKNVAAAFPKGERNEKLMRMGMMLETTLRHVQMQSIHGADRFAAQAMGFQSKMNLMNYFTEGAKIAFGEDFMREVGSHAGKTFDALPDKLQATFLTGGIQKADFELLKGAVKEADGHTYLFPEDIRSIDPGTVKARARELKMTPEKYLRKMEIQYSAIINAGTMQASTTAGAGEKRLAETMFGLTSLGQSGTMKGEFLKTMGQFKAFAIQAFNAMGTTLNAAPDKAALARGVLQSSGKQWANPGYLLVSTTMLYYISKSMQDMARGKSPKDPSRADTWMEAMVASGAGGLYTDFLSQTLDSGDMYDAGMSLVAGPTFSGPLGVARKAGVASLGFRHQDEKASKRLANAGKAARKEGIKVTRQALPFQNFPLVKQGLDYLQYDVIQKSIDPQGAAKSKRAVERKDKEERLGFPWKGR